MSRLKFRRKEKKYTEVYNTIIFKNKNVELTGLYTTIQACIDLEINTRGTDNEFIVNKKTLQSFTGYKDDKFKRIWNELKKAGYLKQYKIKSESGKFEYEYELLDEPDVTTHHSLIVNEDGSMIPNIPVSKVEKLINNPEGEKPPLVPEGEKPHSGQMGDYYNNSLYKVCMYVCRAEKSFDLTTKNKEFITSIKNNIDYDVFEQIVVDANNKNKTFAYVEGTLNKLISLGIKTFDEYELNNKNYKTNAKSKTKTTGSSYRAKKNAFHNFKSSLESKTEDEVMNSLKNSQIEKFGMCADGNAKSDINTDYKKEYYDKCVSLNWSDVSIATIKIAIEYAKDNGLAYPDKY